MKRLLFIAFVYTTVFISCKENSTSPVTPSPQTPSDKYSTVRISSSGGTYQVGEGISLIVPAGAVSSDTTISVGTLEAVKMLPVFAGYPVDSFEVIAGFDIEPHTLALNKPVTFSFTGLHKAPGFIPIAHTIDLLGKYHSIDSAVILFSPLTDSLAVTVVRCTTVTVEANRKLKGLAKRSADCKEGMIIVESGNHDVQCSSQDCQILESRIKVQFLDCPGQPIESAIFRETVGSCELSISVVPASSQISTKSSTPVSATLMLGCAALDGKTVTFSVTGPATINTSSAITSANGIISTTLTAGNQEGTATVKAEATVKYPVREILINGSVEEAFYRTETASGQTDVTIKRMPQSWHIALDVQLDNAPSNIGMGNGHDHVTYSAHVETDISFDTSVSTYCFKNTNGNQTLGDILVESPSPAISLTVENKNAPSSFPCRVVAFFDSSQVYFFITRSMIDMSSEDVAFATWDIRCIYPWQDTVVTDRFIHRFYRCGPAGTGTNFKFPANQNTYTTSGCFTTATYGYEGTYTLTATKITP